ncbi:enkurin [Trichonephila clavata]|uniref:Enkurin n=1 Tax=Trichonephila clavata TaxID=2740835 RepID=A0A8X6KAR9_TRICU|nr:enkurin [Trichonephila clavata]
MTECRRIIVGKRFKEVQNPTESIYNLIQHPPEIKKKSPRYQSKYSNSTKNFYISKKKPHQTMGYLKTPLRNPKEYLKKHTRETMLKSGSFILICLRIKVI